jgi:hypothetical protein
MIFSKQLSLTVIASSTFTLLTTSFFSSADTKYAPLPVKKTKTPYNKA